MNDTAIAVIGLGTMGAPMARNLLAAGHEVIVHNRTRSREEALAAAGARRADSPAEAAREAGVVLICVSDTEDVRSVVFGGETAVAAGLAAGGLLIDCSTISPVATREFAARLSEQGAGWVDAPVSGGSEGAEKGTLAVMCGGEPRDFERARPFLEVIGSSVKRVGGPGAGQVAKAVNQVVISGTYLAVAEGVVLARKLGVDPALVVDAISGGAAASWVLDQRAGNMIADEYPLGFRMRLHRKDLAIALDAARTAGVTLEVAALTAAIEDGLIGQGYGDEDMSALARMTRRAAGLPDGPL